MQLHVSFLWNQTLPFYTSVKRAALAACHPQNTTMVGIEGRTQHLYSTAVYCSRHPGIDTCKTLFSFFSHMYVVEWILYLSEFF